MSFPTVIIAGFFGSRFNEKAYFKAAEGAEKAPQVRF
jgi:LemA protein